MAMWRRKWNRIAAECLLAGMAVAVLYEIGLLSPVARFREEKVTVTVHPESIDVDGSYLLENTHSFPVRQVITFPFGGNEPATDLNVRLSSRPLRVYSLLAPCCFIVHLRAKEQAWLQVSYAQTAPSHHASYVLTSTQSWGRPLERAVFRLQRDGVRIVDSNYDLSTIDARSDGFERSSFTPIEDWRLRWEVL